MILTDFLKFFLSNRLTLLLFSSCLIGPEDTLELCHHLLKANLFKSCGNLRYHGKDQRPSSIYSNDDDSFSSNLTTSLPAKDMQALLILNSTRNASEALACPINVSAPNIKVKYIFPQTLVCLI